MAATVAEVGLKVVGSGVVLGGRRGLVVSGTRTGVDVDEGAELGAPLADGAAAADGFAVGFAAVAESIGAEAAAAVVLSAFVAMALSDAAFD